MAAADIQQRLQMMKIKIAQLEEMLASEMKTKGVESDQNSADNDSENASDKEDMDGTSLRSTEDAAATQFTSLTERAFVGRDCPVGMVPCNAASEECPADLGTNIFNSDGNECMPRKMLRRQQSVQAPQVTTIPDDREVRVKLGLLRDVVQNAAMINSRLLSISRANVSCNSVNSMFPDDSVEDRRAFCSTLVTEDGLSKCEMDAQNKCVERDLTEIRRNAIKTMQEHEKKSRGIVSRMGDAVGDTYAFVKSSLKSFINTFTSFDADKNPLLKLLQGGKLSYSDMMGAAAAIAAAATLVYQNVVAEKLTMESVEAYFTDAYACFTNIATTREGQSVGAVDIIKNIMRCVYTLFSPLIPKSLDTTLRSKLNISREGSPAEVSTAVSTAAPLAVVPTGGAAGVPGVPSS